MLKESDLDCCIRFLMALEPFLDGPYAVRCRRLYHEMERIRATWRQAEATASALANALSDPPEEGASAPA